MNKTVSDPTANTAVGSVDRQLRKMKKEAEQIGKLYHAGLLSYEDELLARRRFTGIFRHLLDEALAD